MEFKTSTFTFRCTREYNERIHEAAKAAGKTLAEWIREALEDQIIRDHVERSMARRRDAA